MIQAYATNTNFDTDTVSFKIGDNGSNCIVDNRGIEAYVGDKIYLSLRIQSWVPKDKPYKITEIRPDGLIVFETNLYQHISGIQSFELASKHPRRVK